MITFEGVYAADRGQAAAVTFYTFAGVSLLVCMSRWWKYVCLEWWKSVCLIYYNFFFCIVVNSHVQSRVVVRTQHYPDLC